MGWGVSGFTPGPWESKKVGFAHDAPHCVFRVEVRSGRRTHRLDDLRGGFTKDDARLIASAPELLEALEQIVVRAAYADDEDVAPDVRSIALTAIAKARGEG